MDNVLQEVYAEGLRSLLREKGKPVLISAREKEQHPEWPDMWVSTYGWEDFEAGRHILQASDSTVEKYGADQYPRCLVVIPDGVVIEEVTYSQFQDTFSDNSDEIGINAYGGEKGSPTEIYCSCGEYRGMTLRCDVSLGEAMKHILKLDSKKFTI